METPGEGALGSLDYTPEERKILAKKLVRFFLFHWNLYFFFLIDLNHMYVLNVV